MLEQSREVNQVWNYSQNLALKVLAREKRFMSAYDMAAYTKGAAKEGLSLRSQTVQAVSEEYCARRKQYKKTKLRWRVSHGSLGWIPVKSSALSYRNGQVRYQCKALSLWDSFGLADYELRSGSFSEDARGRWYLNVTVDVKQPAKTLGTGSVGIDLGLKDFAALSNGQTVQAEQFYRDLEPALAVSQRDTKIAPRPFTAGGRAVPVAQNTTVTPMRPRTFWRVASLSGRKNLPLRGRREPVKPQ